MNILEELENYILGETKEIIICSDEETNQQVAIAMIKQGEVHLDIFSRVLEPAIYDNPECYEVIEDLALRSRHSRIRVLVHDPEKVSRQGHSLMQLGKRLGSLMQFRKLADNYLFVQETFMIVDDIGLMYWEHRDSIQSTANFCDGKNAKQLSKEFNKMWEESEPDPHARYLVI